jgi:hypothetical protein
MKSKKKKLVINRVNPMPDLKLPLVAESILEKFKQASGAAHSVRTGIRRAFTK